MSLLAGCSGGLAFWNSDDTSTPATSGTSLALPDGAPMMADANGNQPSDPDDACGLFFTHEQIDEMAENAHGAAQMGPVDASSPITLSGDPQENLRQAIALDLVGRDADARRLYVWLTAADPLSSISIPCGSGVMLSGKITGLAQKRLSLLDHANPALTRSPEIDQVLAVAAIPPAPDRPNPPQVERNLDFYKTAEPINVPPETSITPQADTRIDVSANTARLAAVDGNFRTAPATDVASSAGTAHAIPAPSPTPAHTAAPIPAPAQPAIHPAPASSPSEDHMNGGAVAPQAAGNVLRSTTRPVESGSLEAADTSLQSEGTMVEIPMGSTAHGDASETMANHGTAQAVTADHAAPASATPPSVAPATTAATPAATEMAVAETQPPATAAGHGVASTQSYYAVQLAAYRSRDLAESRWKRFQTQAPAMLGNASHDIQNISIPGQGLLFRLMTGRHDSKSAAQQSCTALKQAGIDCLIRHMPAS